MEERRGESERTEKKREREKKREEDREREERGGGFAACHFPKEGESLKKRGARGGNISKFKGKI